MQNVTIRRNKFFGEKNIKKKIQKKNSIKNKEKKIKQKNPFSGSTEF